MLTYEHVEDYLEILAGYDPTTVTKVIFPTKRYNISLARYDIGVVNNTSAETMMGQALTDRQGELVVKLILKYRRQFLQLGIDVSPVETPKFRLPLRKVDRQKLIWIESNSIHVKFPYNNELIEELKDFKQESQGRCRWVPDRKVWEFGITEFNINWIVPWGRLYGFKIDDQVVDFFNKILAVEKTPYAIELILEGDQVRITNAPCSLIEYLEKNVGNFSADNLVKFIDYSGVLGYSISPDVLELVSQRHGPLLEYIGSKHEVWLPPEDRIDYWNIILDYCEITQRYPICVYDPNLITQMDLSRFDSKDIVEFDQNGKTATSDYNPYDVKLVYARKIPQTWDFPVPILVSTVQMMYGGSKLNWLNRADKIIYLTQSNLKDI